MRMTERYGRRVNQFWHRAAALRNYSKVLLLYFIYMEDHFQPVELKLTEIIEDTGLAYRSIELALNELTHKGLVEVTRTPHQEKIYKVTL
jgi:DNA-binding MarR family transcriptional regulator